jgi:hypothetical protein
MKTVARYTFFIFIIGSLCGRALGDGKFFVEKVPPDIPYQRALLLLYEGTETLVLQSKYELSQSDDIESLGWVVPVPTIPEIASADADIANICFMKTSLSTQPDITRISFFINLFAVIFFFGCIGILAVLLVRYPFIKNISTSKISWWRQLIKVLIITLFASVLVIITMPSLGVGEVETVKAEKAGIYDVNVIRSQSAEAILGWLRENSFGFLDSDKQVFEEYISRGWCFVVAKVEPETETEINKIVSGGMAAPLILKFKTEKAVYPLKLTSTVGTETEILLYTLSKNKLSCGERLTLRYSREKKSAKFILDDLVVRAEPKVRELFTDIPEYMYLCKFKKKLKPQKMSKDLEFEFAPDNEPYKEKKILW